MKLLKFASDLYTFLNKSVWKKKYYEQIILILQDNKMKIRAIEIELLNKVISSTFQSYATKVKGKT